MSVFDASIVVDALVNVGPSGDAARYVLTEVDVLQAPAILTAEVNSARPPEGLIVQIGSPPNRVGV